MNENNKLNGFNNGRDMTDGIGDMPAPYAWDKQIILEPKLLPCPFCGSDGLLIDKSYVKCSNDKCILGGEYAIEFHFTKWNSRINTLIDDLKPSHYKENMETLEEYREIFSKIEKLIPHTRFGGEDNTI